ncbi:MAG TPA: shikimate dehydrogenase [Stellaceae bacterium]|nr:shikimate dehydrogenase [Stellaceae bacterium]
MKKAGVMGWPVAHSLSPALHQFWLREHGIAGSYESLAVPPDRLAGALRALAAKGFAGCNLTIPHKETALPLMELLDPAARRIGAVNTVAVGPDGALSGYNTDGYGFIENLRAEIPGWKADAGPAVVLGAGGAARAILDALIRAGAPEIRLANRHRARAEDLAKAFGGAIKVADWQDRQRALAGAALLVNATSLGMEQNPPLELDLAGLPQGAAVCDIVYAPLETALLKRAKARGLRAADGLGMLLHQARPAFKLWFGVLPEVTPELRRAVLAARAAGHSP